MELAEYTEISGETREVSWYCVQREVWSPWAWKQPLVTQIHSDTEPDKD